ncbi:MAG: rhomboid family intramembrane serine protease [Candidatus Bathyarchaeia archaeon]|nr:rhomboid family intramembrane serine protease [Candidatus Bathyarchaeota archaeon]
MLPIGDENKPSKRPYVNYMLIVICIFLFLFFFIQGRRAFTRAITEYGVIPAYILSGKRLQTLFTSMFMHADILHLMGNMIYLWVFGDNIEDALGHAKYILFYLTGGIFAGLVHVCSTMLSLFMKPIPYMISELSTPAVGASGAISAVLGAYMLIYPNAKIRTLVFYLFIITVISVPAYYYLGFWFIYQLLMGVISLTGITSGVAFWAHIGGFIFGIVTAKAFKIRPRRRAPREEKTYRTVVAPWIRAPLIDVYVEVDRVFIMAYMPGVEEGDIRVSVSEMDIVIEAERGDIRYYRHVILPVPVIPRIISQEYRNGVLRLTLHRLAPEYMLNDT